MEYDKAIIERCNMEMKRIFINENLKIQVSNILSLYKLSMDKLINSKRTFMQLYKISNNMNIPEECYNKIISIMEDFDIKEPIYLEEVYPYLKEDKWEIKASDISYFKVTVTYNEKEIYNIKEIKNNNNKLTLITDEGDLNISFIDKGATQNFMKEIVLYGNGNINNI